MTYFSYSPDEGYQEHDTAEKAMAAAEAAIETYRGMACDGWSDEVIPLFGVKIIDADVNVIYLLSEHNKSGVSGYMYSINKKIDSFKKQQKDFNHEDK